MGSGRERKHRRRRKEYDDDDDEEGGIGGWKLGLVVAVIVVCFAVLYPSVFHPMLMSMMGHREPAPAAQNRPPVHPGMGGRGGPPRHEHPAMRMAAAQAEAQTQSSGRGMFTWMLPLYTIGVVIFLIYTLFKSKKKRRRRGRYDSSDDEDDDDDRDQFTSRYGKRRVKDLKARLQQTEEAMSKILEQLEQVGVQAQELQQDPGSATAQANVPAESQKDLGSKLNQENEQYIGDLENALKQFKELSAEYDKATGQASSSEQSQHSSESRSSSQNSSEEEEEKPGPSSRHTEEVHQVQKKVEQPVVKRKSRRDQ